MIVTFLGVRGSIPSPGPHTLKYGGNTTCLMVEFEDGEKLIIDAGSGLRKLSKRFGDESEPVTMLLTHSHWDHILGFPFFSPIYQKGRTINLFCNCTDEQPLPGVLAQMQAPLFPVTHESLLSDIRIHRITDSQEFSPIEGVVVRTIGLNHPDPGVAFRIEADGKSLVFVTDNELRPPGEPTTTYDEWVAFAAGCDLLVHDANFTSAELPAHAGWGHSAYEDAVQLGCDAGVGTLCLFHHDTDRSDDALEKIGLKAIAQAGTGCQVELAREDALIKL